MKVYIVGGGVFGLGTALELVERRYRDITVFDRLEIPAVDAASTDLNKIVRMEYGKDKVYTHLAHKSIERWKDWNRCALNDRTWTLGRLFEQCGCYFIKGQSSFEQDSYDYIKRQFPSTPTYPINAHSKFPVYTENGQGNRKGYFNEMDGYAKSGNTIKWMYEQLKRTGLVNFVTGEVKRFVVDWESENGCDIVGFELLDGRLFMGMDKIVLAAGAWSPSLLPKSLGKVIEARGQAVIHIKVPNELIEKYSQSSFPVFCYDIVTTGIYGFPVDLESGLLKLAIHGVGYTNITSKGTVSVPTTVVDTGPKGPRIPTEDLNVLTAFVREFMPDLTAVGIHSSRICWYSDSCGGDFLIDAMPGSNGKLILATGGSGHAFKFAPVLGGLVVDVIEGKQNPYLKKFSWRQQQGQSSTPERCTSRPIINLAERYQSDSHL